jgi:hypothetical protein
MPQERQYPPVGMANTTLTTDGSLSSINAWNATISGALYGNGVYQVTASSVYISAGRIALPHWALFDRISINSEGGAAWEDGNYVRYTGNFAKVMPRFTLDGAYYGDWVHLQFPVMFRPTKCSVRQRVAVGMSQRAPLAFSIYGSNNGSYWDMLYQTTSLAYSNRVGIAKIDTTQAYSYIGLVVSKLPAGYYSTQMNFEEWEIFGTKVSYF